MKTNKSLSKQQRLKRLLADLKWYNETFKFNVTIRTWDNWANVQSTIFDVERILYDTRPLKPKTKKK